MCWQCDFYCSVEWDEAGAILRQARLLLKARLEPQPPANTPTDVGEGDRQSLADVPMAALGATAVENKNFSDLYEVMVVDE
jgi:hypothetical protein